MSSSSIPPVLLDAIAARKKGVERVRKNRKKLTEKLWLNDERPCRVDLPLQYLARLPTPYPQKDVAICENQVIHNLWTTHHKNAKHPNTRKGKPPPQWPKLVMLDEESLQYTVGPMESVLVRDADDPSKIVAVVMRDFCPIEGVVDWVNSIIDENVDERRNVRVRIFFLLLASKSRLTFNPLVA